jgi:hypothetical protein
MDGGALGAGRAVGTAVAMLTQLGLAVVAVLVATGQMSRPLFGKAADNPTVLDEDQKRKRPE